MINTVDNVLNIGVRIYKNKVIRILTQILVLCLCGLYIYKHLSEIITATSELKFSFYRLILAWIILSIIYLFIGTTSWWCILNGFGESPEWIKSANIQLTTTLAKYIPGYVWQYVGKAALSKEIGIKSVISGAAMAFELGQTLLIGIGVAGISYSMQDNLFIPRLENIHRIALPLGILVIIGSFASIWLFPYIISRIFKENISIRPHFLFASLLLIIIGWVLLSISFWLVATSITPIVTVIDIRLFVLATTLSLIVGILFILVPNGIGVRESIMALILGHTMGIPLAVVFATITRLIVTICEISSAFIMGVFFRHSVNYERELPNNR